jgi:hypothetical protein
MQQTKNKTLTRLDRQINRYLKEAAREIKNLAKRQAEDRIQAQKDREKDKKEAKEEAKKERERFKKYQELVEKERAERAIELRKMEEQLKSVGIHYGNISKNLGEVAEEFFFNGLEQNLGFNGLRFRTVTRNTETKDHEYDIILYGNQQIAIIEVKHKLKLKTIEELKEKIKSFKKIFKVYKKYKYYGVLAGFVIPKPIRKKAEQEGLFILTQSGEDIKLLNEKGFQPKVF